MDLVEIETTDPELERQKEFLTAYEALCRKYGYAITVMTPQMTVAVYNPSLSEPAPEACPEDL